MINLEEYKNRDDLFLLAMGNVVLKVKSQNVNSQFSLIVRGVMLRNNNLIKT